MVGKDQAILQPGEISTAGIAADGDSDCISEA